MAVKLFLNEILYQLIPANFVKNNFMRFLITGATGMVGQQLVKDCHQLGIGVNYLSTSREKLTKDDNYKGFYWNPAKQEIDIACFEGVDIIIHLAGANVAERWTDAYKKEILTSRTVTASLLYNSIKKHEFPIKQLVSASAIGCYPSSPTKLYSEDDVPAVSGSFIEEVVEAWENAADKFEELTINVTKIRIGLVLAKQDGALEKITQPIRYYAGAPLGSGEQWQSWIHIKDLSSLFIHCIKNQLYGVFNAVAPNPVTNKEMTQKIAKAIKKPLFLPNVPSFVMKLMLGEMSTIVLSSQLVSSKKIEQTGFHFDYVCLEKALEDLL